MSTIKTDRIEPLGTTIVVSSGITVGGGAHFSGGITIGGGAHFSGEVTAAGGISAGSNSRFGGNVSVSGTAVMASPFMYRNRIINGNMRINQRYGDTLGAMNNSTGGLSFANVANNRNYLVDRWAHQVSGWNRTQDVNLSWGGFTGAGTNTDIPTGFNKFLRVKNTGGVTTEVAGTSYYLITQPIEAENIADFGWGLGSTASAKPATLSFWVRASQTGSWQTSFQINGTKGYANYNTSYTVNSADTWEYKTVTVPAPAIDRPCDASLHVYFSIGKNASNFDSPAGTPVAANTWVQTNDQYIGNTFKSLLDTASAYWDITGVQLEAGTVATPFEHLPMQEQIRLCQRYFEKSVPVDTRAFPPVANYRRGAFYQRKPLPAGASDYLCIPYKVVKRGTPLLGTPVTTWNGYTRNLIVVWSPRTGAIGKFTNDTDIVDGTPSEYDATSDSEIVMLYDAADQRAVGVHWAVDSEI